jgi:arsenate reductase
MAEAFFNREACRRGLAIRAASAGTMGAGTLNPTVVEAMAEIGVPLEGHYPKMLDPEMVEAADLVVSMGCGVDADACPTRFMITEDWGLEDPAGQSLEVVRRVRDQVRARVERLLDELGV